MKATALTQHREALGLPVVQFAKKFGVQVPVVKRAEDAQLPPNHPYIPKLASAYSMTPEALMETQSKKVAPLPPHVVVRLNNSLTGKVSPVSEKRHALAKREQKTMGARVRSSNGKLMRKFERDVCRTARGLVTTINLFQMQGKERADLESVPMEHIAVILNDWLRLNGIRPVVIERSFAGVFD